MSFPAIHLVLIVLTLLAVSMAVVAEAISTAYEVLQQYDFPVGLLPMGVTGYELDASTGRFKAYLNGSCSFGINSYDLNYKSTITGVISNGRLKNLKGISVKIVIFWVNIGEVSRRADKLDFSAGFASANFAVYSFEQSPQCGCGFKCASDDHQETRNIRGLSSS